MKKAITIRHGRACIIVLLILHTACSFADRDPRPYTFARILTEGVHPDRIARLDTWPISIVTSYDRSGGNEDYNNFEHEGPEGWVVLADLEGSGYVSRFWFTGADTGDHRIQIYFDDEDTPRIDTTMGRFCGGAEPFTPPLASYDNYCWYSFIPIPYSKRIRILTQEGNTREGGWPRIFYQVEYVTFPEGVTVESFPEEFSASDRAALDAVQKTWRSSNLRDVPADVASETAEINVAPGSTETLWSGKGPAIVRELQLRLDLESVTSAVEREHMLRDLLLHITWNDAEAPSVSVPLGDFFGSFWRPMRYTSMYFGMEGDSFLSRFPMPFEETATISIENQGRHAIPVAGTIRTETEQPWDANWGYFHAAWNRTTPQQVGHEHPMLKTEGRGHYVGCVFSTLSLDKSWWMLEGDETIRIDGADEPQWKGTGLEDYFNGGWYYQNAHAKPLHGLPFKAPFRTVQYRLHETGPIAFQQSLDMRMERGPDNASRGYMESIAFYYLATPRASASHLQTAAARKPPSDPFAQGTLMSELNNAERLGDYQGASSYIDSYLERFPNGPHDAVLRLRQMAYIEHEQGFDVAKPLYEAFVAEETNKAALQQAKMLLWFHEDPSHALLGLYCNTEAKIYFDGKGAGTINDPERLKVYALKLDPGQHILAIDHPHRPYPDWIQAYLRMHGDDVMTTTEWPWTFNPQGDWQQLLYDDTTWEPLGGTGVKGPPEAPYIWIEPHAYVDMQSQAVGLRTTSEWPKQPNSRAAYRKVFSVP